MKKLIITFLLVIIGCKICLSQNIRLVKDYYSNGKIYSKGYFKRIDNTSESVFGLWTYWYDNGQIKSQEYYYLNKKPVYYINFWQKSGIQILKNGNGYIYETMAFRTDDSTIFEIKDSLKNGNFKCYALEKNSFYLFSTGKYIGGVIHGKKIIYYPNGNIHLISTYKNGEQIGEEIRYYPNGIVEEKGKRIGSLEDSIWTFYDSLGNISKRANYKNSYLSGVYQEYYKSGKLKTEGNYLVIKNEPDTTKVENQKTAKTKKKGKIADGNPFGSSSSPFKSVKNGDWLFYNENGELILKETYVEGMKKINFCYIEIMHNYFFKKSFSLSLM